MIDSVPTATGSLADQYDVAIIGMGPVGITLAKLLGSFGANVLAIDAAPDIYDLPRAIGMDQEVMRVFQQIGVADDLAPFISTYRPSEYRTSGGEVIRRFTSQTPPYPLGWAPYLTFLQPDLERVLRHHAATDSNIDMRTGWELTDIKTDGQLATLTLREMVTGVVHTTAARFTVGCDGGTSFVRKHLNIAFEDLIFDEPWLVVDMIVNEDVELPDVNIQFCDPARPHTFVVGPNNLRRWEFMLMPGETPDEISEVDSVWTLLKPWLDPSQARLWRAATYRFHALVAENWRKGNVFLAGDACHMTPPFLAQGMVQGIKDTVNLAWKLDAALKGADPALLDSYEGERRPLVREVISVTKDLGRIICETDVDKAEARNAQMRQDMVKGRGETVRQNLFPPIGPGLCCMESDTSDAPGRPAPQPRVETANGWLLLDEITGPCWTVLATDTFDIAPETRAKAEALGVSVNAIGPGGLSEEDSVFVDWMTTHKAKAVVTRPDHMVMAALDHPSGLDAVLDRLARLLSPTS
ncbi:bifunctional 3-(3-hydroxy-phenyl)propionate/3-hydroxycinnamic acid hydroxylase [Leisingera sp. ANG59]|uniref:bifunctional 3-(3-hydroxy-phenyl)propionate/3-hydroxycinnamic acid hydroxylase MhpA n=1 Tax=Leisingera sp. ANG59 TaxID=2675221 RepID=UPI0015728F13|nr:bifunctional 3-(3-hydroxy-phenyl)propionate/3-hydroxycinnamic acid hydroxylase [Leisingera sp. ANG59]NSY39355.1 bifunctional 3-(3-hydroxy-phenyl)propionate/3-hydroxycinnamic acid hydroxylase [Leisingera sp. ANG59]